MLAKTRTHHLLAVAFAVSALAACGSVSGAEGSGGGARIIRDPDNPAFTGQRVETERSGSVVRDPDNPYWNGSAASHDPVDTWPWPVRGPR